MKAPEYQPVRAFPAWVASEQPRGGFLTDPEDVVAPGQLLSPSQRRAVRQLYAAGHTRAHLADLYGLSVGQVARLVLGVKRAPVSD